MLDKLSRFLFLRNVPLNLHLTQTGCQNTIHFFFFENTLFCCLAGELNVDQHAETYADKLTAQE